MRPFSNLTKVLFFLIFLANLGLTSQTQYANLNLGENIINIPIKIKANKIENDFILKLFL